MGIVRLKPGREKSLHRRHPWVYSGAVAEVEGVAEEGDTVQVLSALDEFLAWGAYNPHSQICVRVWSWSAEEKIDNAFFRRQLIMALDARQEMIAQKRTNAIRLVNAESDGLPGLVVDRYGDVVVMQCLSYSAERWRDTLADELMALTGAVSIYERSDAEVRLLEGLPLRTGLLRGIAPPDMICIFENGRKYWVDVHKGHKTGFYLDQRQNRALVQQFAQGKEILDCFCYTGGFTVSALMGGATAVVAVDSSLEVLSLLQENLVLNRFPLETTNIIAGDAFQVLRRLRDQRRTFDLIILDPPKFAPTVAQVQKAARGYKDINLLALKLLRVGGMLVTFSCSGGIDADLFQKIVAGAALDAGVEAQVIERLSQAGDHPVRLNFPEGAYLKGLVLRKVA